MSNFIFETAVRRQLPARIGLAGPAGAGKTLTALYAARALVGPNGKIACIDTERGSARMYSDKVEFKVLELSPDGKGFNPLVYVEAIHAAEKQGFDAIVIDSLSHAWEGAGGALEQVDLNAAKYKGNRYAAWRDVTPMHRKLVDTMLQSPCHIIATMRSKMDYVQQKDKDGNTKVEKIGMGVIQREGMEYEFTLIGEIDINHKMLVTKSRCDMMADKWEMKPGVEWWQPFVDWLSSGEVAPEPVAKPEPEIEAEVRPDWTWANLLKTAKQRYGADVEQVKTALKSEGITKYTPAEHIIAMTAIDVYFSKPAEPVE